MTTEQVERRTTRDGLTAMRTTDAVTTPLLEALREVEASLGRAEKRIDAARRARARKRMDALTQGVVSRVYANIAAAERQQERERLERKMFGKRLPKTFRERIGLGEVSK